MLTDGVLSQLFLGSIGLFSRCQDGLFELRRLKGGYHPGFSRLEELEDAAGRVRLKRQAENSL